MCMTNEVRWIWFDYDNMYAIMLFSLAHYCLLFYATTMIILGTIAYCSAGDVGSV